MKKNRLESFSDGVLAILITIMVLNLRIPNGTHWHDIFQAAPAFLSYALSFLYLAIYWNNHHHLLQTAEHVNGRVLWCNLNLLFWLSLIPFVTAWMDEHGFATIPVALYGVVLMFAGTAYYLLTRALIRLHGKNSTLAKAVHGDRKSKLSMLFYFIAVVLSFVTIWAALAIYLFVALMWFLPDRRIEKILWHNAS